VGKHHRHLFRFLGTVDLINPADLLFENFLVEKNQCVQWLILGARSHTLVDSEMLEELTHFSFSHFDWMTFVVKENECSSPMHACVLGLP